MEKFSLERALSLESKYDDSLQTRPIGSWLAKFVLFFSVFFALYHYVTAGIGVPVDFWHMGAHMSGVIILIFISFPALKSITLPFILGLQCVKLNKNNLRNTKNRQEKN